MQTARRWLQNVGLLSVTFLLFFGGIEVFLRVSGLVKMEDYTPPIYARSENPLISYTLKPNIREKAFRNWVTTDEHGFRASLDTSLLGAAAPRYGTTPPFAKTSGGRRDDIIVILGDSITFGYGVADDETLPAQLQLLMPETTVINAGVPGYHIGQEVAFYEEKLAPLHPDILVLVFYWNDDDLRTSWLDDGDVMRAEGWIARHGTPKQCEPIDRGILGLIPGKCWLDLQSAFYHAVKEYVNTRNAISKRDQLRENATQEPQPDVKDFTAYEASLRRLARIAPAKRIFVIWPDATLHETERPTIAAIAERQGFTVIDLYDHFGNTMETLSWDYIHPSTGSLAEAATIIEGILRPFLPLTP